MGTGVTRQAVTKHLHVLGDAGLVRGARGPRPRLADRAGAPGRGGGTRPSPAEGLPGAL